MEKEKADFNEKKPNNNNLKTKKENKKNKTRMYIVLLFVLLVAIIGYVIFKGEYLETLEIGEEYINIFWQNVNYTAITFGINFIFIFSIICFIR